jgi:hypothetical protein
MYVPVLLTIYVPSLPISDRAWSGLNAAGMGRARAFLDLGAYLVNTWACGQAHVLIPKPRPTQNQAFWFI